jgi:hypothetical protein
MQSTTAPPDDDEPPQNIQLLTTDSSSPPIVVENHVERYLAPYGRRGHVRHLATGNQGLVPLRDRVIATLRGIYLDPALEAAVLVDRRASALRKGTYTTLHLPEPAALDDVVAAAREFWPCLFVVTVSSRAGAEFGERLGTPPIAMPAGHGSDDVYMGDVHAAQSIVGL